MTENRPEKTACRVVPDQRSQQDPHRIAHADVTPAEIETVEDPHPKQGDGEKKVGKGSQPWAQRAQKAVHYTQPCSHQQRQKKETGRLSRCIHFKNRPQKPVFSRGSS